MILSEIVSWFSSLILLILLVSLARLFLIALLRVFFSSLLLLWLLFLIKVDRLSAFCRFLFRGLVFNDFLPLYFWSRNHLDQVILVSQFLRFFYHLIILIYTKAYVEDRRLAELQLYLFVKPRMDPFNGLVDFLEMLESFFGNPRLGVIELNCFRVSSRQEFNRLVVRLLSKFKEELTYPCTTGICLLLAGRRCKQNQNVSRTASSQLSRHFPPSIRAIRPRSL